MKDAEIAAAILKLEPKFVGVANNIVIFFEFMEPV